MIRMTVADMLEATNAVLVAGAATVSFEGVCIDSRQVEEGRAFVALLGERVDGNRYAVPAVEAGAHVVVLTREADERLLETAALYGAAVVRAQKDDGEEFMLRLARAWRLRNPQWAVVGVTGSVGKTTTKEMLAAALAVTRRTHATKGNYNNLLGVPLTLFSASPEDEALVVEMGMNVPGEMVRLSDVVKPNVSVVTNVGTSHIGNLGSREGIAGEKAQIVSGMRLVDGFNATLVLSDGDDFADLMEDSYAKAAGIDVLRVGFREGCAVRASEVSLDEDGLPYVRLVFSDGLELEGLLPLPGRAMVFDLLSAMGAAWAIGTPREDAFAGILGMHAARMRLEVRRVAGSPRVIDDTYNASPASIAAALEVLFSMKCAGRRIAVLGEVGELGSESNRLHGLIGAYAAAKPLDMLALVGGEAADVMADAALTMGFSADKLERFATAEDAARVLAPIFLPDDLVLAKGSRSVGLDRFVEGVLAR